MLLMIHTRANDKARNMVTLDPGELRCRPDRQASAGFRPTPGWSSRMATHIRSQNGIMSLPEHDDWDVLEDLVEERLITRHPSDMCQVALTDRGVLMAAELVAFVSSDDVRLSGFAWPDLGDDPAC